VCLRVRARTLVKFLQNNSAVRQSRSALNHVGCAVCLLSTNKPADVNIKLVRAVKDENVSKCLKSRIIGVE